MAHLFKPQKVFYLDVAGKRVPPGTAGARKVKEEARKWYAKGPPLPKGKKVPLASDKRAALQMLAELERRIERGETDIGGPEVEANRRHLLEHLAEFEADLRAKGVAPKNVRMKCGRIRRVAEGCGFQKVSDIEPSKVQRFLAELTERGRPLPALDPGREWYTLSELSALLGLRPDGAYVLIRRHRLADEGYGKKRRAPRATAVFLHALLSKPTGIQTANHYLEATKSFVRWLVHRGRLNRNPLDVLRGGNAKVDLRRNRRSLPVADLLRLFEATRQSTYVYRKMAGPDRMMIYLTACGTGFRVGELAVLTPELFALDAIPPVVSLPARDDKAGRSVRQPLPPKLVESLREYLAGRPPGEPVWPGTWHAKAAEMLQFDLESAGIPYVVQGPDGPLYADFHALRHSFVALLDQAGVTLKQAMQLARHADPKLTMARYGRAQLADLGQAVGRLPELAALPAPVQALAPVGPLDELPAGVLKALAAVGLAAIAADFLGGGCFADNDSSVY